ncbi:MAG TPA: glycosyl hydrolase family 28-related protein [Candidatus Lokiarchaeia archaeon]|nr:glycosyl hydrolase family 28-related protein [Candidatus Lokiarchaeia archaeon]
MFNVKDFGATGDGSTNEAKAIDSAITACAAQGGGIVHFPSGRYLSGTIHVKSNITIDISPGATIATSPEDDDIDDLEDLPYNPDADGETTYFNPSLFRLDNVENVCILGGGIIDGNRVHRLGPKPIAVKQCTRVTVRDIKVVNAPNYAISFIDSEMINVDNAWIDHAFADGIDFDGCWFGRISNCSISSADDSICLKASPAIGKPIDCSHIAITNCTLLTPFTCFKLGSETGPGNFMDISLSNCTFGRPPGMEAHPGGISISSLDGAIVERMAIANVTMHHIGSPISLSIENRGRGQKVPVPGSVQDISIANIVATDATSPCGISGIPGHRVKNVSIHDVTIELGPSAVQGLTTGAIPACVFHCRHAENVQVRNYNVIFPSNISTLKPAAMLEDVERSSIVVNDIVLN